MTTTRRLVLWVKRGDPPSERAQLVAESWRRLVPPGIALSIRQVDERNPEVSRAPCLNFLLGDDVVYAIEGDISLDAVICALRRLG